MVPEPAKIVLYAPAGAWGLPSISPFCVKLETWLRMAGIAYRRAAASPQRAPKGKMPYVDPGDGTLLGDSQLILEHLTRTHAITMDDHLSPEQRAVGHAVRRMLEEGSYWALAHERWMTAAGWAAYRPVFGALLPAAVRWAAVPMVRRSVRRQLHAQGTGRHTEDEVAHLLAGDLDALAVLLGETPFVLGVKPSSVDACAYGMLASILDFPVETAGRRHIAQNERLVAYVGRMRARWWGTEGDA